jgi:hypothetical protein
VKGGQDGERTEDAKGKRKEEQGNGARMHFHAIDTTERDATASKTPGNASRTDIVDREGAGVRACGGDVR